MNLKKSQKRAVYGLALFLLFMLVCTLVSKGIYQAGLPRVAVATTQKKKLIREIAAMGTIKPGQEYGIYLVQGLRVRTIFAKPGDNVEAGETLFQIETEDLQDIIAEKEQELANGKAQLADRNEAARQEQEQKQKNIDRLKEDYEHLIKEQDLSIARKRHEYDAAKNAREQAEKQTTGNTSVSGGDAGGNQNAGNLEALRQAERQAALALEDAILAKEKAVLLWSRDMADAEADKAVSSAEGVSLKGQLSQMKEELEALYELQKQSGNVMAKEAGTILDSRIAVGERTQDNACMLYAAGDGTGSVEVPLTEEDLKYLSIGDTVKLSFKSRLGETKSPEGVIQYLERRDTGAIARIELADEGLSPGQNVTMKYTWQSETYPMTIPLSALHGTREEGFFVYTVEERMGILGMEQQIRKVFVELCEQNSQYAAIESGLLTEESLIVTDSSKELEEGAVVRVME